MQHVQLAEIQNGYTKFGSGYFVNRALPLKFFPKHQNHLDPQAVQQENIFQETIDYSLDVDVDKIIQGNLEESKIEEERRQSIKQEKNILINSLRNSQNDNV